MWVQSQDQEDALEKRVATHSSILTCKIPWTEEPGALYGVSKGWTQLSTHTDTHTYGRFIPRFFLRNLCTVLHNGCPSTLP